jgi:ABC-type amino acid transport substrate-binding protein
MLKAKETIMAALAALFMLASFLGCARSPNGADVPRGSPPPFASFRDVPFVTDEEIKAIEGLQKRHDHFVYGANYTTEAFPAHQKGGDEVGGFSALFCEWLTGMFGIPFKPAIFEWDQFFSGLENGNIHFTGDLAANERHLKTHFMTSAISERSLKTFKIAGAPAIADIAKTRLPRLAFPKGFAQFDYVTEVADYPFEPVFVNDYAEAYRAIKSSGADAFLTLGIAEPALERYGDVVSETFYPLVLAPMSLSTQDPALEPIISVMQKMLDSGCGAYLTWLYGQGNRDYIRNKFIKSLTADELAYIQRCPTISIATEADSYPLSFYNSNDGEFQGIAFDVLKELEQITGLTLKVTNDAGAGFSELIDMLETREASMITAMMRSRAREGSFLLPKVPLMQESPVLILNVAFDRHFDITFGFNKDEAVLCAIVDKAVALIDLEAISSYWAYKGYDYRAKVAEARLPWLIATSALFLVVFILVFILFQWQRREGRHLESLVEKRTQELDRHTERADIPYIPGLDFDRGLSIFEGDEQIAKLGKIDNGQLTTDN